MQKAEDLQSYILPSFSSISMTTNEGRKLGGLGCCAQALLRTKQESRQSRKQHARFVHRSSGCICVLMYNKACWCVLRVTLVHPES